MFNADGRTHGFEIVPGRAMGGHVSTILRGVFLLISIYLITGVGAAAYNLAILETVGKKLRYWDLPYVILGDWQMEPAELEATGWV